MESPEINPDTYGQLIYNKAGEYDWEKTVFSLNNAGKKWTVTYKRMRLAYFDAIYKNKLKMY